MIGRRPGFFALAWYVVIPCIPEQGPTLCSPKKMKNTAALSHRLADGLNARLFYHVQYYYHRLVRHRRFLSETHSQPVLVGDAQPVFVGDAQPAGPCRRRLAGPCQRRTASRCRRCTAGGGQGIQYLGLGAHSIHSMFLEFRLPFGFHLESMHVQTPSPERKRVGRGNPYYWNASVTSQLMVQCPWDGLTASRMCSRPSTLSERVTRALD
jgi:hypothetical protein